MNHYEEIGLEVGEWLKTKLPEYFCLLKKWQNSDLRWPFSDIDLRLVVTGAPRCWIEFNYSLLSVHRAFFERGGGYSRVFEHSIGFVYTLSELLGDRIDRADVKSWSRCHEGSSAYPTMNPVSENERQFSYHLGILRERVSHYHPGNDVSLTEKAAFSPEISYCVAWHYFAPIYFAYASLRDGVYYPGKLAALSSDFEALKFAIFLLHNPDRLDRDRLFDRAVRYVQALPQIASYVVSDYRVSPASEAIWALSTLRCRLCRYLFYAELPPSRKTSYLIRDEVSKLDRVSRALNNIPGFAKNSAALNKVIGCFALADADQNGLNSAILRIENESALVNDIFNSLAEFVS